MSNPYQPPRGETAVRLPPVVHDHGPATWVRFQLLAAVAAASVMLYLDRVCLAQAMPRIQEDLNLAPEDVGWILGAFFLPYALCQVPSGWLSDRFGGRIMLTVYIAGWSLCTALTPLAGGVLGLFLLRLALGAAQAGAYPTAGAMVGKWMPPTSRGMASSVVAFGGRIGGALAPLLTAVLLMVFNDWRPAFVLYGVLGLFVAAWFWIVARDRPREHPGCNPAELRLIEAGRPPENAGHSSAVGDTARLAWGLLASPGMWMMCVSLFTTNVGWVLLITLLPLYLTQVHNLNGVTAGAMATMPLTIGVAGTLLGGPLTDWSTRLFGLRWGRALPLGLSRFLAAGAYLLCPLFDSPTAVVAAMCLVAVGTDLGVGATWAYMQDVGGRFVASCLGWGNMFGNLGAAAAPPLLMWLGSRPDGSMNWTVVFLTCSFAFALSGVASLLVNAERPILPEPTAAG